MFYLNLLLLIIRTLCPNTEWNTWVNEHVEPNDIEILYRVVESEATDGTLEQKMNVASCVLARVESDEFPDSIRDVVFQKGQFAVIADKRYYSVTITDSTKEAVRNVLFKGKTTDCLFFCTPTCQSAKSGWFSTLQIQFNDGMHIYTYGNKRR